MSKVYKAQFAGSWYPDNPNELNTLLDSFVKANKEIKTEPECKAIVSPHAGMMFSGATASSAFQAIPNDKQWDTVVLLGPTHKAYFHGISICNFSIFDTPIGKLEIDTGLNEKLLETSLFSDTAKAYVNEHSLEMELPFLIHRNLKHPFKILPLVFGDISLPEIEKAMDSLKNILADGFEKTLFIVSTDFTHFGENFDYTPFSDNIRQNIEDLDMGAIKLIEKCDSQNLNQYFNETKATVCGSKPLLALTYLFSDYQAKLIKYTNSGKITGDWDHSVSYASIVVK